MLKTWVISVTSTALHPNNSASRFHLILKLVEKKSNGNVNSNLNFSTLPSLSTICYPFSLSTTTTISACGHAQDPTGKLCHSYRVQQKRQKKLPDLLKTSSHGKLKIGKAYYVKHSMSDLICEFPKFPKFGHFLKSLLDAQ